MRAEQKTNTTNLKTNKRIQKQILPQLMQKTQKERLRTFKIYKQRNNNERRLHKIPKTKQNKHNTKPIRIQLQTKTNKRIPTSSPTNKVLRKQIMSKVTKSKVYKSIKHKKKNKKGNKINRAYTRCKKNIKEKFVINKGQKYYCSQKCLKKAFKNNKYYKLHKKEPDKYY